MTSTRKTEEKKKDIKTLLFLSAEYLMGYRILNRTELQITFSVICTTRHSLLYASKLGLIIYEIMFLPSTQHILNHICKVSKNKKKNLCSTKET